MEKIKVGFITIGQSPRPDIMVDMMGALKDCEVIEAGALDGYTQIQIEEQFPMIEKKSILVTKLRNDTQIQMNESYMMPLIQKAIVKLEEKEVEWIVLLCTGDFENLKSGKKLLESSEIVTKRIATIGKNKKVAIFIPDEKQIEQMRERWIKAGVDAELYCISPFMNIEEVHRKVQDLNLQDIDLIMLDCMGYGMEIRECIKTIFKKTTFLARELVAQELNTLA